MGAVKKLYENGQEVEPQITVIDNLVTQDATKPLSARQGYVLDMNKIGKLPASESGSPYAFFYNAGEIVTGDDRMTLTFDRLVINDGLTKYEQSLILPKANLDDDKAGLYTKAFADAKLNKLPKTELGDEYKFVYSIETPVARSTDVSIPFSLLQINNGVSKGIDAIEIPTADIPNNKCGVYSKALADQKISLLPKVEGVDYSFPYAVKEVVQDATTVKATFDTLVINDGVTKADLTLTIPSAIIDAENNKAGLYSKAEADKKVSVERGVEYRELPLVADSSGNIISSNILGSEDTKIYYKSIFEGDEIATKSDIPVIVYDTQMSDTSINGVQNKVIKNYVDAAVEDVLRTSDVLDVLDSTDKQKPLSANKGRELNVKKADKTDLPTITQNGVVTKTPVFYAPSTIGDRGMIMFSDGTNVVWRYMGEVFQFQGVCTYEELQSKPMTTGHIWTISDRDYNNYICDGTQWIDIGKFMDMAGYQTKNVGVADRILMSDGNKNIAVSSVSTEILDFIKNLESDAQSQLNSKLSRVVSEREGYISTIDNTETAHGCKMRVDFGSTVGAFTLYNDNGDNGIIGQILAINPTTRVGARINITKNMICYGTGTYIVADTDHEIAVKGEVVLKNTAITAGTKCKISYDAKGLVTGGGDIDATDVKKMAGYTKATAKADITQMDTLNSAVGKVEYRVESSEGKITTAEEKITALETNVSDLTTRMLAVEGNVTRLESSLNNLTTTVSNLSTTVSTLSATVSNLQTTVNALNTRIQALENANLVRYE